MSQIQSSGFKSLSGLFKIIKMNATMFAVLYLTTVVRSARESHVTEITDQDWLWFYERITVHYVKPDNNFGQIAHDRTKCTGLNLLGDVVDASIDDGATSTPMFAEWQMNSMLRIMSGSASIKPEAFQWAERVFGLHYKTKQIDTKFGPMMFYNKEEIPAGFLTSIRGGNTSITNIRTGRHTRTRDDGTMEFYNGGLRADTTDAMISPGMRNEMRSRGITGISTFGGSGVTRKPVSSVPKMGLYDRSAVGAQFQKATSVKEEKTPEKPAPKAVVQKETWQSFSQRKPPKVLVHFYKDGVKYICKPTIKLGKAVTGTVWLKETNNSVLRRTGKKRGKLFKRDEDISKRNHTLTYVPKNPDNEDVGDFYVICKIGEEPIET